jgi:5S rRNA maturation endonuclease (ribonuclease M5)
LVSGSICWKGSCRKHITNHAPVDGKIVVVENYETFLRIDFDMFSEKDFIYLGGYSNKKVSEFLENKEVLFFGDFDFAGIMIFNSLKCKNKEFFIPDNLEEKFNIASQMLYQKQRKLAENLELDKNTEIVYNLCMKYAKCLEQEVYNKN